MITNKFQKKAYDAVAAALPFKVDPSKVTVEPGVSYMPSPIKLHDYAAGVMAAFGSVVEYIGDLRGLPSQTMILNRRLCGFHINELQGHLQCANTPQAIQAAVEKHTAQKLEDEVAGGLNLALGMVRSPQEWLAHSQGAATAKLPLSGIHQHGTTKKRL